MKIFLFALATGLIITNSCLANCYNISDSDLKYACLAETKNDEGYCYRISNSDDKFVSVDDGVFGELLTAVQVALIVGKEAAGPAVFAPLV